jgi:enamine deaminase RidA (YjgF/YER057c/UK114 family)
MTAQAQRWKFSQAVLAGQILFCSGQIGAAADGTIPDDPQAQFEQALQNVNEVLAAAGLSIEHVIDMTSYHVDMDQHFATFASVRDRWAGSARPAWTALGVAQLAARQALVEVKVTAWAENAE